MIVDTKAYEAEAHRTISPDEDTTTHYVLGAASEAGELAHGLKQELAYYKPWDPENVKEEIGDVLWYLANLARLYGFTLGDAMEANIAKLRKRYPVGFTEDAASIRADKA